MNNNMSQPTKESVSVAEMARTVGLSRALLPVDRNCVPASAVPNDDPPTVLQRGASADLLRSASAELRHRRQGDHVLPPSWRRIAPGETMSSGNSNENVRTIVHRDGSSSRAWFEIGYPARGRGHDEGTISKWLDDGARRRSHQSSLQASQASAVAEQSIR